VDICDNFVTVTPQSDIQRPKPSRSTHQPFTAFFASASLGIDGAIKAIVIIAPEVLQEKLATERATRVRGEQHEQFIVREGDTSPLVSSENGFQCSAALELRSINLDDSW